MFLKPFKVKSNSAIKGSDRKKLRANIGRLYISLTPDDLSILVSNKEEMSITKLCTHGGHLVTVYSTQKYPVFFEVETLVYPTVYTLWQFPELLPTFTTWPPVFEKLSAGADLMLPGVVLQGEYGADSFGRLKKGDMCAVNLSSNAAPIAVGKAALSSEDMFMSGKRGKGVIVLHTYQDQLWATGDKSVPPSLPSPISKSVADEYEEDDDDDDNVATEEMQEVMTPLSKTESDVVCNDSTDVPIDSLTIEDGEGVPEKDDEDESANEQVESSKTPTELMDDLLYACFIQAWKTSAKKVELPLLTSTFYRAHMLPCCPKGETMDVKKSSYKKLSKFLQEMQNKRIIEVKELSKGVESIVGVDLANPEIRAFVIPETSTVEDNTSSEAVTSSGKYEPPQILEMHTITAAVLPLFKAAKLGKGAAVTSVQIRRVITDYVKSNELQSPNNKNAVTLDPTLTDVLLNRSEMSSTSTLRWEDIMNRCIDRMKPAYQIKFPGQAPVIKKGSLEPISLAVVQRASNKKVTLVHNLETYGVDPEAFAHTVQIGVAASTSVYPAPNKKEGSEVMIQGNQVKFIASLLLDDYTIPKKYIKGLENAPKQGKKR